MGDRAPRERNGHHLSARPFDRLADGLRDLVRLARREADFPLPVADGHERIEREAPAAFHDLGDTVDGDHVLDEIAALASFALIAVSTAFTSAAAAAALAAAFTAATSRAAAAGAAATASTARATRTAS